MSPPKPYSRHPRDKESRPRFCDVFIHGLPISAVSDDRLREFLRIDRSIRISVAFPSRREPTEIKRVIHFPSEEQAAFVVAHNNFRKIDGHILYFDIPHDWQSRGSVVKLTLRNWIPLHDVYHHFNRSRPVVTVLGTYKAQNVNYVILFNTVEDARKAVQDNGDYDKPQPIPITVPGSSRPTSRNVRDADSDPKVFGAPSTRHTPLVHSRTVASGVATIPSIRPTAADISSGNTSMDTASPKQQRPSNKAGISSGHTGRDSREEQRHSHALPPRPRVQEPVFECSPASKVNEPIMNTDTLPYVGNMDMEFFCAGSTLPRKGRGSGNRALWCKGAFLSYESLHNLSSASEAGGVAVSSVAWGSQLDVSTITLNFGSEFRPVEDGRDEMPKALVSSLSVTVNRYGDRDSASELLSAQQKGELPRSSSALNEIAHARHYGRILQMKCVESGHLVTVSARGMNVWDSDLQQNQSKPLTTWDTCRISVHPHKDQLLVGSATHGRAAFWDTRSTVESLITFSHKTVASSGSNFYRLDPMFDCEWNHQDEHSFMTAHPQMIRIWDARNTARSVDQVEINYGAHNILYRARWSPHHRNVIAGLWSDGLLRIWCTDATSKRTRQDEGSKHELLFVHNGHHLAISDFSWCPYVEDTIVSVAPSTTLQTGEIQ
ncbi:Histone-binding protein rbbp4, partial [Actinomortierella ambigua]